MNLLDRLWRAGGRRRARRDAAHDMRTELCAAKALIVALEADRNALVHARSQLADDNTELMQGVLRVAEERDAARTGCLFLLQLLVRAHDHIGRQQRIAMAAAAARGWTVSVPAPIDRGATVEPVEAPIADLGDVPATPLRSTQRACAPPHNELEFP